MFKIESYIGPLLMGYLNKYVKLNEESFKLSLWGGDAVFHNLELQYDILEHLMPLPIGFKSGQVHELKIHIPWTKLGSESVIITLNTVECILELKSDFIKKNKTDKNQSSEKSSIKSEKLSPEKQKLEKNLPPGYIKTYMYNIVNNIHVKVNNLIIKFVEDDIVLSMNAKTLEYYPVTEKWTRGFVGMSAGGLSVNKVIEVSDLTVCLDQMDANGHIELYQEPILYRCSVECRFFANYPSINSNSPNFIKLNIQFGQIDFNIATSQMPMIRRLMELVYALYYGVVNWDSIVGCGFSKQMIVPTTETAVFDREMSPKRDVETHVALDGGDGAGQASWASWAWSYMPTIFGEDESIVEEDQFSGIGSGGGQSFKKIFNFSVFFQSINWRIKKSHVTKSLFGSRRSNCNKTLTHFFTVVGNNIGLNIANNGLGFFNVQLGCTDIKLFYDGNVCVCGQDFPINHDNKLNQHKHEFLHIGDEGSNGEHLSDFYLTGNLFSQNESSDINFQENDSFRLNSINSQESYSSIYSQEKCLKTFPAMWFDYTYFMQIVKNNLDESQIDLTDLCNTDGIRESSQCNLYIGKSTVQINSYFVHNMKEIIKSLDTSRYLSYFLPSDDVNERHNLYYSTEEQVARIHEFVPVRRHNVCLVQLSINLHPFTESHQITDPFPIIKLKTDNLKFSRVSPMYPRHLVGCVSTLHMNLLKESSELINKCYILKSFSATGFSVSFLLPEISYTNEFSNTFHETTMLEPCDMDLHIKWLLYPESWKTSSLIVDDMNVSISNLQLKLVPSHIKTSIIIVTSNYSWISVYLGYLSSNSSSSAMNKRLDDLTVKLLGSRSTLVEACHKYFYKNKTYELHVSLPKFVLQTRKTFISFFVDIKVYQDDFLLYLQSPESSVMIPVLDNRLDSESSKNNKQSTIFVLSCQIPNQKRPVNCAFNLKCQIGSMNFMISQPLISWFIYPLLDVDLDKYIESDIFPMFSSIPRKSSVNHSSVTISDIRSMADGSSRPESPNIFFNKHPVPGHPRPISINLETPKTTVNKKNNILSNKTGWWNIVKDSCSKYFFLLQSLDVSINMARSNIYIATLSDISSYQSDLKSCDQWVEKYLQTKEDDGSIFLVKMTRLALVNSQRRDYLNESFLSETLSFQAKPATIIDSLPWELIFHDIRIDCLYSLSPKMSVFSTISHDSILKPVSINCTLSATPKCSSPDKLETLYSVSWGVHVDITEVQPTIKQIYLAKIFNLFSNIVFKLPWSNFIKNVQYLVTGHYKIVQGSSQVMYSNTEPQSMLSKQSISTKSTRKSKSSAENNESAINSLNKGRLISSKLETQSVDDETKFKLSFWIQCTLSQFQLVIMNDRVEVDHSSPYVYLMLQVDDATSCIDVQEKFVEIKGKLGSILCQIGLMKNEKIVSEIPILKTRSKFISNEELPFSYKSCDDPQHLIDDMNAENIIRHCLSIAVIRTTPNNLSKRPISTYHHFKDSESFKSYPTEFTGNFSDVINVNNKYQSYITQISSVIEPFDLYLPPFFLKQCIELSNTFVSLCNQLLQNSVKKWSLPNKLSSPVSASSIKNEPYFISEDMPKFYLLIKSSRIILPRFQNENYNIYNHPEPENGCIIATWKKISVQPFSNNAISRPEINKKLNEDNDESVDSQSLGMNCLDDNRQFQLDVFQCGIFLNQYNDSVTSLIPGSFSYEGNQREPLRTSEAFSTSVLHGQNPAFEWNNFSKMSSFIQNKINVENAFFPIMKPIDIQIIFAGALHESSNMGMKRQLIGGYGLEINILTNLEFSFDNCALDFLTSIIKNTTEIFHQDVEENKKDVSGKEAVQSLEDLCRLKNIDSLIPCVPINVLMTTRKIQILCLLLNSTELNVSSSVYGLCLSISQPHAILSFRNRQNHKFEISFFDVNLNVTPTHWSEKINFHDHNKPDFWFNREFFILAEMKTLISSKPGRPNIKTGVPASLLTVTFSNFYKSSLSECVINITRHVLANFDIEDIEQLMGFIRLLSGQLKSVEHNESSVSTSSPTSLTYSLSIFIPSVISLNSELFSFNLFDRNNKNKVELKFGPLNVSSSLITNHVWNNLHLTTYFKSDTLAVIHSFLPDNNSNSVNEPRFLLYPNKIIGKLVLSQYRFNSLDDCWRSLECSSEISLGAANISVEESQIVFLYQLIMKVVEIVTHSETEQVQSTNLTACEKIDKKIEIFYDELRTNKFKLITNTSCKENDQVSGSATNLIADEGTISFSDDNDDVASMLWTYPEPRCIISLEVKPVPFVFIECNFVREDNYELLQIPCRLEYWNNSTNQYELYQTFNLSENQTEKISNLPTVEQLSRSNVIPVVAKSWRVVFDCYARYFSSDSNINSNAEKAMLIYLSPLVLAASLKIDSCYGSFRDRNFDIKFIVPQIEFVFHENKKEELKNKVLEPFKLIIEDYQDYSVSDHNILFKCFLTEFSFKQRNREIKEINVLKLELLLSNPFMSLQTPITVIEKLHVKYSPTEQVKEQLEIDMDACQMGLDIITLRQLYVTFEKMKDIISALLELTKEPISETQKYPMILFCNNLDRRIRIHQKEDNFFKMFESTKIGGLGSGEAVILKFFSENENNFSFTNKEITSTPINHVELLIGLYSELKGIYKWTESIELLLPNFNNSLPVVVTLGMWKLDVSSKQETSIITNSSSLFNSFNAKNLFYIHKHFIEGINKIIVLGNTIMNNSTPHFIQICFSLPSELSSGVTFTIPPLGHSMSVSQYINWKYISLSNLKNMFELSFRIVINEPDPSEYHSLPYQVHVPNLSDISAYQQQIMIKLKLYNTDGQIISSRTLSIQFLCTLEWFRFSEGDEILLLITLSPLMIFENLMLHDVKVELSNSNVDQTLANVEDSLIIPGKGGTLKLMNLFLTESANLNTSFLNDNAKLFENPLIITENDVLISLSKKLNFIYENKFSTSIEKERIDCVADLISQVIENSELFFESLGTHNPYSITVTITPWILISNKTQLDLVLSFDKNVYYLESNSDFVPSKSDKPMKIGIAYKNDVYWSKQFVVGKDVINQTDNSFVDVTWNFIKTDFKDEAVLQMNIVVGRHKHLVPLTLKHVFVDSVSNLERIANKFHHLIIESTIFVSNQTDVSLNIESLWLNNNLDSNVKTDMHDGITLYRNREYFPVSKFHSINHREGNESNTNNKFVLKINLSDKISSSNSLFNCLRMVDFNVLTSKSDSEIVVTTDFLFVKDIKKGSSKIGFRAFNVNTSVSLTTQKIFVDIFECKFVPIKFTNWSDQTIIINELTDATQSNGSSILQIEPRQSVPYWPNHYQVEVNQEGCGQFTKSFIRFRLGIELELEVDWTEYFPLTFSEFPSNMHINSINRKEYLQLIIDSDECAKIHINIYGKSQQTPESVSKHPQSHIQTLSISRFSFSFFERQMDMEILIESVRISVEKMICKLTKCHSDQNVIYELLTDNIQIDNKLFSSGHYDFPVFLNSLKAHPGQAFMSMRIETNDFSVFSINFLFQEELEFFIENAFLYDLLRLSSQFYNCVVSETKHSLRDSVLSMPLLNVINIHISPVLLRMTVHAFLKIYVSCESTSLGLPEFVINDCSLRLTTFQKRIWHHYATAVLIRCGCVLGSIELLGNPNGIVRHLSTGFTDLLSSRNIDHGLLVDFILRILSFCRHTSGGFISSFTGIASSVSRNLDYFTLDEAHVSRQSVLRRQSQTIGVMHSFFNGLSGFALSLLGAIAGLADQPLQASQEALNSNSSVSMAVIKGLGKGLIGVVTKPLSGTAELLAQTGKGLLNTTGISINRFHSNLINVTLSSKSEILINTNQLLFHTLTFDDRSGFEIPILLWSSVAINEDQVPVYLFLTDQYLIEWHIDHPLKNRKTLYLLSNYKFSVIPHSSFKQCLKLQYIDKIVDFSFNTDYRISAFISELQYSKELEPSRNDSRKSSMDSTDYVKFISPTGASGHSSNCVDTDNTTLHSTEISFYSFQCLEGILDSLTFLSCQRNLFSDSII